MNPAHLTKLSLVFWFALAAVHPVRANDVARENPGNGFRLERTAVPGGAQLITLFSRKAGLPTRGEEQNEVPILSVLRDTLGDSDPANDRFRQVWVYSYAKPSLWQKFTASLPFFYYSTLKNRKTGGRVPAPFLDLGNPRKGTWRSLTEALLQTNVLDGVGMTLRLTSRSYRGNVGDYRKLHLWQAVTALSAAESTDSQRLSTGDMGFPDLGARLVLATRPLGGLVSEKYLQVAWERQSHQSSINRGHNWELLRQQAEETGLHFQPLSLAGQANNFALLWAAGQPSPMAAAPKSFKGQFLGIPNSFANQGSCEQDRSAHTGHLDSQGNPVTEDAPGARAETMTPLALYALDHPRVPLLLVDFCNPHRTGTGERMRRFATDLTVNVLGLASLSNWQYLLAKSSYMFVRKRHGAALDRSARTRAYAQLQYSLKFDSSLDPELRRELGHKIQGLGLNPLGVGLNNEVEMARSQHAALLEWATSPDGLAREVQRDRAGEIVPLRHSRGARILFGFAHIGSLGLYRHRDDVTEGGWEALDRQRRFAFHKRFLERVLASGPRPEVAWNAEAVGRSVDALSELGRQGRKVRSEAAKLISALMREIGDEWIYQQCVEGLHRLNKESPTNLASRRGASPAGTELAFTDEEDIFPHRK
jgi:hypothetical protein